jgi:hypothetical protein
VACSGLGGWLRRAVWRPLRPRLPHLPIGISVARVTKCIFCGSPELTREHIFPRWTHRYLPPRQKGRATQTIGRVYPDREGDIKVIKLRGQMRDWKVECVCGGESNTCNNGWMREIENKSRPIIIPLIQGMDTRISPEDQEVIAT